MSTEKSINDATTSSTSVPMTSTRRKGSSKKAMVNRSSLPQHSSYEHHLEKWLENTSKMNFDYNNLDGTWPFNTFQQQPPNRTNLQHPHDPISLPSQINTIPDSASIASFMNFNANFKQQYPHLQRQQSHSPVSNDQMTSMSSQQECFSLPTIDPLKNDRIHSTDQEKLISQTRRLNGLLINDTSKMSKNGESSAEEDQEDEEGQEKKQIESGVNNKALILLMSQINLLHETNSKIFRNLQETKVEMEALKYAPTWGLRHRRDSVSGLSVHSQPFGYGGITSPAPTYHSQGGSNYPGVVTDLIREVRDAGRIRDESLMNRVKDQIDEKTWSLSEAIARSSRDIEEIKGYFHTLKLDRQATNERINKLEDEVRHIKSILEANINMSQQITQYASSANQSNLVLNEHLKRSNLSYNNTVNNSEGGYLFDESFLKHFSQQVSPKHNENVDEENFDGSHVLQLEKDTLKLRRDLQDAIASKKHAETRILALEHLVTSLKTPTYSNHHSTKNQASVTSEFLQPQQHQLQIQINGADGSNKRSPEQHISKSMGGLTTGKLLSPKTAKASQVTLSSAAGPVTDL